MKKIIATFLIITSMISCNKGEDPRATIFPGYSGKGEFASWVVFKHTINDVSYVTGVLPTLTPPTTYASFDAMYTAAKGKELSPVSIRLYSGGEVAMIVSGAWVKQTNLKWELVDNKMFLQRNNGTGWIKIGSAYNDQNKFILRLMKAFFGDSSADKEKFVMEVVYSFIN